MSANRKKLWLFVDEKKRKNSPPPPALSLFSVYYYIANLLRRKMCDEAIALKEKVFHIWLGGVGRILSLGAQHHQSENESNHHVHALHVHQAK